MTWWLPSRRTTPPTTPPDRRAPDHRQGAPTISSLRESLSTAIHIRPAPRPPVSATSASRHLLFHYNGSSSPCRSRTTASGLFTSADPTTPMRTAAARSSSPLRRRATSSRHHSAVFSLLQATQRQHAHVYRQVSSGLFDAVQQFDLIQPPDFRFLLQRPRRSGRISDERQCSNAWRRFYVLMPNVISTPGRFSGGDAAISPVLQSARACG